MAGLSLSALDKSTGLYSAGDTAPLKLLYQSFSGSDLGDAPDAEKLWDGEPGCWFFLPETASVADPEAFRDKLGARLLGDTPLNDNMRWFAWIEDPNAADLTLTGQLKATQGAGIYQVQDDAKFAFGNVDLTIPDLSTVVLDADAAIVRFSKAANSLLSLVGTVNIIDIDHDDVVLHLGGTLLGAFSYTASWLSGALYALFDTSTASFDASPGPEMRYFFGAEDHASVLRFPFRLGALGNAGERLHLSVRMDPLHTTDETRTLFGIDVASYGGNGVPSSTFYRTPMGNIAVLTPQQDVGGYALSKRYDDSGAISGGYVAYLVPGGLYDISVQGASLTDVQLMCGIGGTEFLLVGNGDTLEFVSDQPAFARDYDGANPASADLDATFTTAWVRVRPKTPGDIVPGYCVQAADYLYFGPSKAKLPYPLAVGCQMASLARPADTNAVPLVPYSAIYSEDQGTHVGNPNPDAGASVFVGFERRVIAKLRRGLLRPNFDYVYGPKYFDIEDNTPFAGGTIRTSKGFLATLSTAGDDVPAGACINLQFARSPEHSALADGGDAERHFLQFEAGANPPIPPGTRSAGQTDPITPSQKVISPLLSNALEDDNLFLVAASTDKTGSAAPFGKFANEIAIGEFIFQIDTGAYEPVEATGGSVMVMKFAIGDTVADLIEDTDGWAEKDIFLGQDIAVTRTALKLWYLTAKTAATSDASDLTAALQDIPAGIADQLPPGLIASATAMSQSHLTPELRSYFLDVYRKMTDAEWTGVLSFNCPLPYGQLTPDLQMLLGGITGRLQGFHFGITANHLSGQVGSGKIKNSSLFGLIYHLEELDQAPAKANTTHFQVPDFKALFTNSALTLFESKVAMTIPQLYGDQVALTDGTDEDVHSENGQPAGIMIIDGAYQKSGNGGEGAVVFDSTKARTFDYTALPSDLDAPGLRAIDHLKTSDATLVPVNSDTQVPASLAGKVATASASSTVLKSAFRLSGDLAFTTDLGGGTDLFSYKQDPGLRFSGYPFNMWTVIDGNTARLAGIIVDPTEVLVDDANCPLRANSLIGTLPMRLRKLDYVEAGMSSNSLGAWQVTQDKGTVLETGGSVQFALDFTLPLGTLGGLVSSGEKLFSSMYLGWQPVGDTIAGANKIALLMKLPDQMGGTHGSFKYQGLMELEFDAVKLVPKAVKSPPDNPPSTMLQTLEMTNVKQLLFNFVTLNPGQNRKLSFFGNPRAPHTLDLLWFLDDLKLFDTKTETFISFTPFIGMAQGLDVKLPVTQIKAVGEAITALTTIPGTTQDEIASIWNPDGQAGEDAKVKANPDSGALFFLSIFYTPLSLQILLDDPSFYGGRLAIGAPEEPKKGEKPKGKKGSSGPLATLGGMEIEIIYRRVNDHLGALSVDFVFPDILRKIYFGPKENPETPVLTLPEIGIEIFIPNGDFKVAIGWPFGGTTQLSLKVPIEGVPILFALGFYFAKLRGEDLKIANFGLIYEFGFGVAGGPVFEGEAAGGIITWDASLSIRATVEGFLASDDGQITEQGAKYHWYAVSAGIHLHVGGKVDFKIISAELSIDASLTITVAWETQHMTHLVVAAYVSVELSVKVVFFSIHFSISVDIKIVDVGFGSGPVAKLSGPSPEAIQHQETANMAFFATAEPLGELIEGQVLEPLQPVSAAFEATPVAMQQALGGASGAPVAVGVYFALQPAAVLDPKTTPFAVASFYVETATDPKATATTPFNSMALAIVRWIAANHGAGASSLDRINAMQDYVQSGAFHGDAVTCLSETVVFHFLKDHPTKDMSVAAMPAFPQLGVSYNGKTTGFDVSAVGQDYEAQVQAYFGANAPAASPSELDGSVAGIVFVDYFVMIAKNVISAALSAIEQKPQLSVEAALAPGQMNYANVAGIATRFLKHGLRLPYPDPTAANLDLLPLFKLTGQMFALDRDDKGKAIRTADLIDGSGGVPGWIAYESGISAELDASLELTADWDGTPGWTAEPMPAIAPIQQKYMLTKRYDWTDAAKVIRALPEALVHEAARLGGVQITTEVPPATPDAKATPGPSATLGLRIPLTIRKIPVPGTSGSFVAHVYQVVGANEADREVLQGLVDAVEAGKAALSGMSLLSSPSSGKLATIPQCDDTILVKTDLTKQSAPSQSASIAPTGKSVNSAKPTSADAFLRLIWEVSIVHRAGFYLYEKSIPDSAFNGNTASLTLFVALDGAAARTLAIQPYVNSILIEAHDDPDACQVEVSGADGKPIFEYRPNLAAGSAGYRLTWPKAPTEAVAGNTAVYIQQSYHVVSSRIATAVDGISTNWSQPIAGLKPQPSEAQGDWHYRSSRAIFKPGQSRYANIGKPIEFHLGVVDIFGNIVPENRLPKVTSTVQYTDSLVPSESWFGCHLIYLVTGPSSGKVTLTLTTSFTPDTFVADPANPTAAERTHARHALQSYLALRDQLADDNVSMSVQPYFDDATGARLGLWDAPITADDSGTTLKSRYAAYMDSVIAWLEALATSTSLPSAPSAMALPMSFDAAFVADPSKIEVDLFPLKVRIAMDRAGVPGDVAQKMPEAAHVDRTVPPMSNPGATNPGDTDNALREFAQTFEAAYAGYDGQGGRLKLGQGTNLHDASAGKSGTRALWITRWGAASGMAVSFRDTPTYFGIKPLCTQLLTGSFEVRDYKTSGWTGTDTDFTTTEHRFNAVDLDAWASAFLTSFKTMLGPQYVVGIPLLPGDPYGDLIAAKALLADQFTQNTGGSAGARVASIIHDPAEPGDQAAAAKAAYNAMLSDLNADYATSAIIQVPASVSIKGGVESGVSASSPPNVFGKANTGANDTADTPYTIAPVKLPLVAGNETASFLVSAKHPGAQEELDLNLTYSIGFLEHDFEVDQEAYGYVPSSWITFILPDDDDTLNPVIGPVDVPIPLRGFPPSPVLISQSAQQADPGDTPTPDAYMNWTYRMQVSRPKAEQDDLLLAVRFNQAVSDVNTSRGTSPGERSTAHDLFEALARYSYEWPALEAQLSSLSPDTSDPAVAAALVARFQTLVDDVTATLPDWTNPALPWVGEGDAASAPSSDPQPEAWFYRVVFFQHDLPEGSIRVTRLDQHGKPSTAAPWPDIAGYSTPDSDEATADYSGGPTDGALKLTWPGLYVLSHQSVRGSALIERNVDIVPADMTTNPDFVYRTPEVFFPNVLTPQIEALKPIEWASHDSLGAAVKTLLADILTNADGHVASDLMLHFDMVTGYEYKLVKAPQGTITSSVPMFLAQEMLTFAQISDASGFDTTLTGALIDWRNDVHPSEVGGALSFALTFFAADSISDGSLVLVHYADLRIPIPEDQPDWWSEGG